VFVGGGGGEVFVGVGGGGLVEDGGTCVLVGVGGGREVFVAVFARVFVGAGVSSRI